MSIETLSVVDRVYDGIVVFSKWVTRTALTLSVLFVLIEVFFRYVLNHGLAWPEELPIRLFIVAIFFSIPISFAKDNQPRLEIMTRLAPKSEPLLYGVSQGIVGTYLVTVLITWFTLIPGEKTELIPSLRISTFVPSMALPVGIGLTILVILIHIARDLMDVRLKSKTAYLIGLAAGVAFIAWLTIWFSTSVVVLAFIIVIVLIVLGVPIAVSLGLGAMVMVVSTGTATANIVTQNLLEGGNSFVLLAIPFFILTGALVAETSLGSRLVELCKSWVGWVPGGLGVADVAASALFANMSGSAIADTAAIGTVMIPGLVEVGYSPESAVALQASAGVIGVVFPPAVALILFGFVSQASIIKVFEAAIIPGLLVAFGLAMTTVCVSYRVNAQKSAVIPFSLKHAGWSTLRAVPGLLIPLILLGGILSGAFTPSEAGAVAILVALVISGLGREITGSRLLKVLDMATDNIGIVMFVLVNATAIGWAFTATQLGASLQWFVMDITASKLTALLIINLILLLVHFFVETAPSILVMVPLLMPVIDKLGISPMQFAAVVVVNSTIGQVMPPVGVNLFIASKIGNVSVTRAVPKVIPYVVSSLIVLLLVTLFPGLSTWLPGH